MLTYQIRISTDSNICRFITWMHGLIIRYTIVCFGVPYQNSMGAEEIRATWPSINRSICFGSAKSSVAAWLRIISSPLTTSATSAETAVQPMCLKERSEEHTSELQSLRHL